MIPYSVYRGTREHHHGLYGIIKWQNSELQNATLYHKREQKCFSGKIGYEMSKDLIDQFESRMSQRGDEPQRLKRFVFAHKMVQYDDGPALWVALFDWDDPIDCEKHTVPGNINTDKALNRWGSARMQEFKMSILEVFE